MSRSKRLEDLEQNLPELTIEQLEAEIPFWTQHAQQLQPKIRKLAMKRVHKLQAALRQKLNERDGT